MEKGKPLQAQMGLGGSSIKHSATDWCGLTQILDFSLSQNRLNESVIAGTLILFPKQRDLLQNWRTRALNTIDYMKILNEWLAKIAHNITKGCQANGILGRYMPDSLCLFRETFQMVPKEKWKGHLMQRNQVKAFDNVHHDNGKANTN